MTLRVNALSPPAPHPASFPKPPPNAAPPQKLARNQQEFGKVRAGLPPLKPSPPNEGVIPLGSASGHSSLHVSFGLPLAHQGVAKSQSPCLHRTLCLLRKHPHVAVHPRPPLRRRARWRCWRTWRRGAAQRCGCRRRPGRRRRPQPRPGASPSTPSTCCGTTRWVMGVRLATPAWFPERIGFLRHVGCLR